MLRVHQLSMTPDDALSLNGASLLTLCARRLKLPEEAIASATVVKRSVDARRGTVNVVYTADVRLKDARREPAVAARFRPNEAAWLKAAEPDTDLFHMSLPEWPREAERPIVVGAGPGGLFCALTLALRGARPLLIERGCPVEERAGDIELLESGGELNEESNVLFGEGGAGAFSDGKLTCGLNSPLIATVLRTLAACGAPEEILTAAKPHIGTDKLREVLPRARKELIRLGGEVYFHTRLTGLEVRDGRITGARVMKDGKEELLPAGRVYLAIGHSARDTYRMLRELGVPMERKPFAMGVRIEHPQTAISRAQYGSWAGHPALGAADYKLNARTKDGRGVYTFCMCPGGRVINASSEKGQVNVNGMSLHARDGENANAALLVGVNPADFPGEDVLGGIALQEEIERAAFAAAGDLRACCVRVGDFLKNRVTIAFGDVVPSYRPGVFLGSLDAILPEYITGNLRSALPELGGRLKGFDAPDALLTGPETRSSSPVRILRDENMESALRGLFPIGEGAGYAGGIVSAAVDGIRAGMAVKEAEHGKPV